MVSALVYSDYNHTVDQLNLIPNNNEFLFLIAVNKKLLADDMNFCHKHELFFSTDLHCFS